MKYIKMNELEKNKLDKEIEEFVEIYISIKKKNNYSPEAVIFELWGEEIKNYDNCWQCAKFYVTLYIFNNEGMAN